MIVEDIKKEQLKSRKDHNTFRTGVLTTLLGEVERIGKDSGNRQTTNEEAKRIIKKFIKNINETLKLTDKNKAVLNKELEILNEFLPDEMSDFEISNHVKDIINEMKEDSGKYPKIVIGTVMKIFKARYSNFDAKTVSDIIRSHLK